MSLHDPYENKPAASCIIKGCTRSQCIGGYCEHHASTIPAVDRRGARPVQILGESKVDPAGFGTTVGANRQFNQNLDQAIMAASQTIDGTVFKDNGGRRNNDPRMSVKYPQYYKPIPEGMQDIDIYGVCNLFRVDDPSGALQHALKKILLPGVRTGGKSRIDDIKEARDTLTRWLELHK